MPKQINIKLSGIFEQVEIAHSDDVCQANIPQHH